MKKIIFLIIQLFIVHMLFAYELRTINVSDVYANELSKKPYCTINKNEIVYFDKIVISQFYIKDGYKNGGYTDFIKITSKSGIQGFVSVLNLSSLDQGKVLSELKQYIWTPAYEMDVLYSRNRDTVEKYVEFYKQYFIWKKYTDWEEDKWHDVYCTPYFIITDSVVGFDNLNCFGGRSLGILLDFNEEKNEIKWQCIDSISNNYTYDLPDYISNKFKPGEIYTFSYFLDGDYFLIYYEKKLLYTFVRINFSTASEVANLIYPVNGRKFDYTKIVWPRHADGTCDYDGSSKLEGNEINAAKRETILSVGMKRTASTNLRLRSTKSTSSTVITTMGKGTAVTVIAVGDKDTIDGIASNWVRVEIRAGAKDKDGKPVSAGTTGWCFGGYLE